MGSRVVAGSAPRNDAESTPAEIEPRATAGAVVEFGAARFTLLSDTSVRLEWSASRQFEDRASLLVVNRRRPAPQFERSGAGAELRLRTTRLRINFRDDGKPFHAENLRIEFTAGGMQGEWRPGMANGGNLRGTARTLDCVSGGLELEPGVLSRDGWVLLDDSQRLVLGPAEGAGPLADWPWPTRRADGEAIDWYFLAYGQDYRGALREYTSIAGRVPLPPRYVFGAWWSRYWAYSDAEFRALVREFREHDTPLDVLVVDMDWHLDGWTGYTWNPRHFADPEGFLRWAHGEGLRVALNLHPADGVGEHEACFAEFCRAMQLDREAIQRVPFNATDRRFVAAYFSLLHHPLERQGVDFWWMDWQQGTSTAIEGLDPLFWLNHLHWTDWERTSGAKAERPLIFSRWGGLGNHRYPIGFSGDAYCDWATLAFQPHFTATASNVAYAYWSHDIGGHQPGPVDAELYARWIQWGALSPILRTHTTKHPDAERRIWRFEPAAFEAARAAWRLRYELLPYVYSAARQCHDEAVGLCRPLYYDWPDLDEAYRQPGQYLFGEHLLVAPVCEPINPHSGLASTLVWIPPGEWRHWFTGRVYSGPKHHSITTALNEIPLFVRAGATIPLAPPAAQNTNAPLDPLVLRVFAAPECAGVVTRLYEDDGLSRGYERGEAAWTEICTECSPTSVRVTVDARIGTFAGIAALRGYELQLLDRRVLAVRVDGRALTSGWSAGETGAALTIPPRSAAERVVVEFECDPAANGTLARGARGLERLARDAAVARLERQRGADPDLLQAARRFGLFARADLSAAGPTSIDVTCEAEATGPGRVSGKAGAAVEMRICDVAGWTPGAERPSAAGGGVVKRFEIAMPLQPRLLRLEAEFELEGRRYTLPVERTVFPGINGWWVRAVESGPSDVFVREISAWLRAPRSEAAPPEWSWIGRSLESGGDLTAEFRTDDSRLARRVRSGDALYAAAIFHVPTARDVRLVVGTAGSYELWLNETLHNRYTSGRPWAVWHDVLATRLDAGLSVAVLRVDPVAAGERWFSLRFEHADGAAMCDVDVRE